MCRFWVFNLMNDILLISIKRISKYKFGQKLYILVGMHEMKFILEKENTNYQIIFSSFFLQSKSYIINYSTVCLHLLLLPLVSTEGFSSRLWIMMSPRRPYVLQSPVVSTSVRRSYLTQNSSSMYVLSKLNV